MKFCLLFESFGHVDGFLKMSRILRHAQQQRQASLHQCVNIAIVLVSLLVLSLHYGGELHQNDLYELVNLRHIQNEWRNFVINLKKKRSIG